MECMEKWGIINLRKSALLFTESSRFHYYFTFCSCHCISVIQMGRETYSRDESLAYAL